MEKKLSKIGFIACVVIPLLIGFIIEQSQSKPAKEDPFEKPYRVERIDEHRVNLISDKDTVVLTLKTHTTLKRKLFLLNFN